MRDARGAAFPSSAWTSTEAKVLLIEDDDGDALLVEVARRLRASIRTRDTLARLGGDEFVILADVGEAGDAVSLAEKLLTAVREPVVIDAVAQR